MEKQVKEKSQFKKFASDAKARLKNGYWQRVKNERMQYINNIEDQTKVNTCFADHLRREIMPQTSEQQELNMLYQKLCNILNNANGNVINPISALMPYEQLETLSDTQRELFVIKFSEKVRNLVKQYEKEKEYKIV